MMARRGQPAAYDFGDDYAAALREQKAQDGVGVDGALPFETSSSRV